MEQGRQQILRSGSPY